MTATDSSRPYNTEGCLLDHQPDCARKTFPATGFNKREFAKLVAARFGVTLEEGVLFFDEIGQRMGESLAGGETVFLFGQGTLKVVKSRSANEDVRIRFRPTTRTERAATVTIEGMPGIATGVITDAIPIKSVSAGARAIQVGRACTAQGPDGRLVLYIDDRGRFRGLLLIENAAPVETIMDKKKAAKEWLRDAFTMTAGCSQAGTGL
ncbi:hypothetical protein [Massilia sp. X63]|uniref:hypothetical protein n=1 Tax=Massilia sp. X63 TaxID=3237285 RepID=UPI0034DD4249